MWLCRPQAEVMPGSTGHTFDVGNDAAFNTYCKLSATNTKIQIGFRIACIYCCLITIIAGAGNPLNAGNNAASDTCKRFVCIQNLPSVSLYICLIFV